MLKVLDVFRLGTMLSVTLEGSCENIANGSRLKDADGNIIVVSSVAMTRHNNPTDMKNSTTVLINDCEIKEGCELSIA